MTKDDLKTLANLPKTIATLRKVAGYAEELRQLSSLFGAGPPPQAPIVPPPVTQPEQDSAHKDFKPGQLTFDPGPAIALPPGVRHEAGQDDRVGMVATAPRPPEGDPDETAARLAKKKEERLAYLELIRKQSHRGILVSQFANDGDGEEKEAPAIKKNGLNVSGT